MEIPLLILAVVLSLVGMLGCVIPGLPGPPLNYAALLIIQWQWKYFETWFLILMAAITLIVLILDYVFPLWAAKKFGATKQGIWGSIIGMFVGIFLTPLGMIAGILLGAILGDMMAGRKPAEALKSGIGTFAGTIAGIVVKLIVAGIMTTALIIAIVRHYW